MRNLGPLAVLLLSAFASAAEEFPPAIEAAPKNDVWVSFSRKDLARPGLPLSGAPVLADNATAVYKVKPEMLPVLAQYMHDAFHRCGGFFAHGTQAAAQAAMRPSAIAPRAAYTLDQQAAVTPLVASISAANMQATIASLAAFNNRYYQSDTGVEAARWIKNRWSQLAAKIPGASVALVTHDAWKQPSVVLTIPGSEKPEEIVVLGGHLDSINGWGGTTARAPGADDNASGIAVLTEVARVLGDSGLRPKRTIQIMGYAAEEVGLRGSQDIANKYAAAGRKVIGVIQFDMSNFAGDGDKIFLLTDNVDPALSAFTGQLIDAYAGVPRGETECGYGCSDHASWTKKGYASAMAFESSFDGMNHKIHTEEDTLANSGGDASHSVPFAKLAAAFAIELAKTAAPALKTAAR